MRRGGEKERARGGLGLLPFVVSALLLGGCESCLMRVPAEAVERLPYPSCGEGLLPEGEVLASGHLRSGPTMLDRNVVERYELRRRDCLYVMTVRQEWPLGTADVEVVYDDAWRPLRAWKRMTLPTPDGHLEDIRLYELRTDPVTMIRRSEEGIEQFTLRGPRPIAVIGPGRGLLGAWIRAADPAIGATVRGPVLDFRELFETIDTVALKREADREVPELGGTVRVYTVFGREAVFVDEALEVVGDLAGLRPNAVLTTPPPPPQPLFGAPDPVHTP